MVLDRSALAEPVRPDYTIRAYTDNIYKVVWHRSTAPRLLKDPSEFEHTGEKLDSSLSRTRSTILELALCNDWSYFCTFTLDKKKYDRYNLDVWSKAFKQWLRDQRKKYPSVSFDFLLIPEMHQDGAWHMHGLFSDISPLLVSFADIRKSGVRVPDKLINGGYYNWTDYQRKFGFCSFGPLKNAVAASFYVQKYITKDLVSELGKHSYSCSRGLKRSSHHGDVYGLHAQLDQYLVNDYDFCKTGFTSLSDGVSWDFAFEYMDFDGISPLEVSEYSSGNDPFPEFSSLDDLDYEQLSFLFGGL